MVELGRKHHEVGLWRDLGKGFRHKQEEHLLASHSGSETSVDHHNRFECNSGCNLHSIPLKSNLEVRSPHLHS